MKRTLHKIINIISKYKLTACITLFIYLFAGGYLSYSQDIKGYSELSDAISKAKSGKYQEAIPVLKKLKEVNEFDDFTTIQVSTYLNWCLLFTDSKLKDVDRINNLSYNYFNQKNYSNIDSLQKIEETLVIYILGHINKASKNFEKSVFYFLKAKKNLDEQNIKIDEIYLNVLDELVIGYSELGNYPLALEMNSRVIELRKGGKHPEYITSLSNLAISYSEIEDYESALKIELKVIELIREVIGENSLDYLSSLNNITYFYSGLEDYKLASETLEKVIKSTKEILGESHPDYQISLNNLLYNYIILNDFQSALKINQKLVLLIKEQVGENHSDYLNSLNSLSNIYAKLGDYPSVIEIYKQVGSLIVEKSGLNHPDYLKNLNKLSNSYSKIGDYQNALEVSLEVVKLGEKIWGVKDPQYLNSLSILASIYSNMGEYQKSLEIRQIVLRDRQEVLGKNHPDYLKSLNNLASSYSEIGDYNNALKLYQKVSHLDSEILGEKHRDYLTSLSNLAFIYSQLGDLPSSLELSKKVVQLEKEILGEKHENYINSLNNLALTYSKMGDLPASLEIGLKVVELSIEVLGENHPLYISYLSNLGAIYLNFGDVQSALSISKQVLRLRKETLGEKHPDFLLGLNNLGSIHSSLGNYKDALSLHKQVYDLGKDVWGEKHPNYLTNLNNLALVYSDLGDYEASLVINLNLVDLNKEVFGEKHSQYFISLNNLASNYSSLENHQKAFEIEQNLFEARKNFLGEKHPDFIWSSSNLALSEFYLGKYDLALYHTILSTKLAQEKIINFFSKISDFNREGVWKDYKHYFHYFYLFLEKKTNWTIEDLRFSYDIALFTKGLLINTALDFESLLTESGSPETLEKFKELKLLKLQIQRLYEKPISDRILNVDSLEIVGQKLETDLVKLSKEYGDYTRNLKINWEEVQSNLGEKDVAIEFLEYPTLTDTVKYAALVLRSGWENPKFVPLFRKDQIDEIVNRDPNQIYSNGIIGKETRNLIWDPLEEYIGLGDKVHFSAAGILHHLAIENLSYDESTTLGDRYQMNRLSSTKELALKKPESKNQKVALYGGIKYDLSLDQMIAGSEKYGPKDSFLAIRGFDSDSLDRKGWQFLPGTLTEANEVSQILREDQYQVTEFIGESGSEESLKDLSGKRTGIIHIATHGFFLPVEQSKRNLFIQKRFDDRNANAGYVDPMLRSGLLFAGGNRAWQGDSIPETIEDGILTAKEISQLDLRETDLVVLSACETGLGDVSSEGVFGLQRAFKQAGAQTLIMSLWNVKDDATQYLMTNFYSYLTQGASKREAFIQARNKCRERYQDPASWAAFIMLD